MQHQQHHWGPPGEGGAEGAFLGGALVSLHDNNAASTDLAPPISPTSPSAALSGGQRSSNNGGREPGRPPRPMNAWLLFRTAQLKQIQEDNPGLRKSQGELSKIISSMWKTCDPEVRSGYEALAKERKLEHARAYPDYRYAPGPRAAGTGKASKAKKSPSSTRKASLRLSPSQTGRASSISSPAFGPSSTPTSSEQSLSAEPLYAHQYGSSGSAGAYDPPSSSSSSSEGYGSLPTPGPLSFSPSANFTPPQTAAFPSTTRWRLPSLPQDNGRGQTAMESQERAVQYQPREAQYDAARIPASAPATVTRFTGRSLGLSFVPNAVEGEQAAYETSYEHLPPSVPSSAATSSFPAYVSPSQYLSPPATASFSSSSADPSYPSRFPQHPQHAAYPPPPALAAPPRTQQRATYGYTPPATAAGPVHRYGSQQLAQQEEYDEPPLSPFSLPPQAHRASLPYSAPFTAQPAHLAQSSLAQVAHQHVQHQQHQQPLQPVETIPPSYAYSRPPSASASSPFTHPRTTSYDSSASAASSVAAGTPSHSLVPSPALQPVYVPPHPLPAAHPHALPPLPSPSHQLHHPVPQSPFVSPLTGVSNLQLHSPGLAPVSEHQHQQQQQYAVEPSQVAWATSELPKYHHQRGESEQREWEQYYHPDGPQ
ncbi:hypothetical protein JCM6882_004075 [Rhodosporidiobolus microsporus]